MMLLSAPPCRGQLAEVADSVALAMSSVAPVASPALSMVGRTVAEHRRAKAVWRPGGRQARPAARYASLHRKHVGTPARPVNRAVAWEMTPPCLILQGALAPPSRRQDCRCLARRFSTTSARRRRGRWLHAPDARRMARKRRPQKQVNTRRPGMRGTIGARAGAKRIGSRTSGRATGSHRTIGTPTIGAGTMSRVPCGTTPLTRRRSGTNTFQ
mmetsp:Transcript_81815/g.227863  ORF Transcript_81815/g.227863 Transcript_81815/m.227863 type:complete len:213 (+) Transcript_81815:187-825(+)